MHGLQAASAFQAHLQQLQAQKAQQDAARNDVHHLGGPSFDLGNDQNKVWLRRHPQSCHFAHVRVHSSNSLCCPDVHLHLYFAPEQGASGRSSGKSTFKPPVNANRPVAAIDAMGGPDNRRQQDVGPKGPGTRIYDHHAIAPLMQ